MKYVIGLFAIALIACGKDATAPVLSPVGTWNLATIDGKVLPVTILAATDGCPLTVQSASYSLSSGGAYTARTQFGIIFGGDLLCSASSAEDGNYVLDGNTVTLHSGSFSHTLTLGIGGLNAVVEGRDYAYRK